MTNPDAPLEDLIADLASYLRAAHLRCHWISNDHRHRADLSDEAQDQLAALTQSMQATAEHLVDFLAKVEASRR